MSSVSMKTFASRVAVRSIFRVDDEFRNDETHFYGLYLDECKFSAMTELGVVNISIGHNCRYRDASFMYIVFLLNTIYQYSKLHRTTAYYNNNPHTMYPPFTLHF